jgi:molybdopterin biosynthesis enzyme
MATTLQTPQIIARLTPLAEALAAADSIKPVTPRAIETGAARGRVLAADAKVPAQRPARALALLDGWALTAEAAQDAGAYAPAPLAKMPPRIGVGEAMPDGADAVAPLDAVAVGDGRAEAVAPVAAGDGVLPAGADAAPEKPLRRAGERIRNADVAVLTAAGISRVNVREPKLLIVNARGKRDEIVDAAAAFIARDADANGGLVVGGENSLEAALRDEKVDAVIAIGGTGSGADDASVQMLARAGRVKFHGIGLTPGETAAFGFIGARPVLLLPGRLDAVLAVWLVIGRRILARLSACEEEETAVSLPLARKVTSTVGLAEFVPVHRHNGAAEPLATKYLPLSVLARANGWFLVPPDSEGYPAGAQVPVRRWP